MLLPVTPIIFRKRAPRPRRPRRNAPPAALHLVSASYDENEQRLTLAFDRAIDVAGIVGAAIVVNDATFSGFRYVGTGGASPVDPESVVIDVVQEGEWLEPGITLDVAAANGIVAVDDGGTWGGVTALELPFP